MGALPSLLTIPSTEPSKDAEYLLDLFPKQNLIARRCHDGNGGLVAIILSDLNSNIIIYIIASSEQQQMQQQGHQQTQRQQQQPNQHIHLLSTTLATTSTPKSNNKFITTMIAEKDLIKRTFLRGVVDDSIESIDIGNHTLNRVHLPSGSSMIYMIPPDLLKSSDDRIRLVAWLAPWQQEQMLQNQEAQAITENTSPKPLTPTWESTEQDGFIKFDTPSKASHNEAEHIRNIEFKNKQTINRNEATAHNAATNVNDTRKITSIPMSAVTDTNTSLPSSKFLPSFPSLDVRALVNGKYEPFPLNSSEPFPIETDLFKGKMSVVVRPVQPDIDDPYWNERIFSKKKRRLVIQVQGKFKYVPKGILYAGAEVSDEMKLGLITRGIATIMLRLVEKFNSNMHYSFGDPDNNERPHIVAPAYTFFDCVIATPADQVPPRMDQLFEEDKESVARRKKESSFVPNGTSNQWNTSDTYSFSFYSMYIDLPTWQLIGVPARGDLSLKTFWGNSLLNICMYESLGTSNNNPTNKFHFVSDNRYAFSVQAQYLGQQRHSSVRKIDDGVNNICNASTEVVDINRTTLVTSPASTSAAMERVMQNPLGDTEDDTTVGAIENYDETDTNDIIRWSQQRTIGGDSFGYDNERVGDDLSVSSIPKNLSRAGGGTIFRSISNQEIYDNSIPGLNEFYKDYIDKYNHDDDDDELHFFDAVEGMKEDFDVDITEGNDTQNDSILFVVDKKNPSHDIPLAMELLHKIDYICPAWIDVCSSSKIGAYYKVYAVNLQQSGSSTNLTKTTYTIHEKACDELIRSASCKIETLMKANFSPRLSASECMRRAIGIIISYRSSQTGVSGEKLAAFTTKHRKKFADLFFQRPKPMLPNRQMIEATLLSCFVARAISDRHWVEEFACITPKSITFLNPVKLKIQFCIPLSSINKAEKLPAHLCPTFIGFYFLAIRTLGRTHYVMFHTAENLQTWINTIDDLKTRWNTNHLSHADDVASVGTNDTLKWATWFDVDNPAEEFSHKSTMWKCKSFRILNCGEFFFHPPYSAAIDQQQQRMQLQLDDPMALVEDALRKGLDKKYNLYEDYEHRRSFLNAASALKRITFSGMSEDARLSFFLNLYHVMLSHAFLAMGPPDTSLKWITYFSSFAYEVGDDVFTLTELEHCIIRAKMTYPSHFISRFVLPKSVFRFALTKADYRINFALNCGSLSNPAHVLIYRPDLLNQLLDKASEMYLARVSYTCKSSKDIEIRVPKMCQWYFEDFGSSNENLLKRIEPYLPNDLRVELRSRGFVCNIRYTSFKFECRTLSLLESA